MLSTLPTLEKIDQSIKNVTPIFNSFGFTFDVCCFTPSFTKIIGNREYTAVFNYTDDILCVWYKDDHQDTVFLHYGQVPPVSELKLILSNKGI